MPLPYRIIGLVFYLAVAATVGILINLKSKKRLTPYLIAPLWLVLGAVGVWLFLLL